MKRGRRRLVVVGAVLVAALVAEFFFNQFERVEVEVANPPNAEMQSNPFHVAELLFQEMGLATERRTVPGELPPTDHVLLFLEDAQSLGGWQAQSLSEWIERGGHLVYSPALVEDSEDEEPEDEVSDEATEDPEEDPEEDPLAEFLADTPLEALGLAFEMELCPPLSEGQEVTMELMGEPLSVEIRSCPLLDRSGQAVLATGLFPGGEAASVLRYARGAGLVTVLADPYPLINDSIGKPEHAMLAWRLIAPSSHLPAGVVFVRTTGKYVPSLALLLLRHGWPVLVSGALVLWLFFWGRGARFGPIRESRHDERRSLLEHVEATGAFLWRQRLAELLIESTRQALERQARRRIPGYGQADRPEQTRQLAERTGLDAGRLASALARRSIEDPAELTRVIRTLETARRSL